MDAIVRKVLILHPLNLHIEKREKRKIIPRLYSVKTDIFKNAFFWNFFIRNDLSRVDLIIKMVLEFLSNL